MGSAVLGDTLWQEHSLTPRCAASTCCRRPATPAAAAFARPSARPPPAAAAAATLPLHGICCLLHGRRLLVVLLPRWQRLRCICTPRIRLRCGIPLCLPLLLLLRSPPPRGSLLLRVVLVENVEGPRPPDVPQPQLAIAAAGCQLPFV